MNDGRALEPPLPQTHTLTYQAIRSAKYTDVHDPNLAGSNAQQEHMNELAEAWGISTA